MISNFLHRSLAASATRNTRAAIPAISAISAQSLAAIPHQRSLFSSNSNNRNDSHHNNNNNNSTNSNNSSSSSRMNLAWPIVGGLSLFALYYISTSDDWKMKVFRRVSLRWMSRTWGVLNNYELPVFARLPLYRLWAYIFNANLDEASAPLESYVNLQAFFTRNLKDGVRPLAPGIVSPVDATVACVGEVKENNIFIVKGLAYNLEGFLGDYPQPTNPANKLFFTIFYLGPGDYHGIHAPCDWEVQERRHYPGMLLSVSGFAVKILKNLFFENERVVLLGRWLEGYISVGMVGATNVGSIKIPYEKDFITNRADQKVGDSVDIARYASEIPSAKGEEIGFFHLGSSVVMIFEHSADFQFDVKSGDKVKIGTALQSPISGSPSHMSECVVRSL